MNKDYKQLKPYQGILIFIISVLMILFIAAPIQNKWGMYGLLLTEIILLLLGVVPAVILKVDLKGIFPVKKPKLRQMLGVISLWAGTYITVLIVTLIIGYLFPQGLSEVNDSMQGIITSVPTGIAFLIIAVSPAICEEVLFRGVILSSLHSLKNKWMISLCVGILFGIFHLDPYRFLPTALLGMTLTYIMIETKNILLPALFHLINNGVVVLASFATQPQAEAVQSANNVTMESLAVFLIIGSSIPYLFYLGIRLLQDKERNFDTDEMKISKNKRRRNMWVATGLSIIMIITGIVMISVASTDRFKSSGNSEAILDMVLAKDINDETEKIEIPFKVETSGSYIVDFEIVNNRGLVDMKIINELGDEVYKTTCMWMTGNTELKLKQSMNYIILDFHLSDIEEYSRENGYNYDEKVKGELNLTGDSHDYLPFEFKIKIHSN